MDVVILANGYVPNRQVGNYLAIADTHRPTMLPQIWQAAGD